MTARGDVNSVLSAIVRVAGDLSALDWVLIGLALLALAWGWVRAAAFARLGSIQIGDITADGDGLKPAEMKAELRRRLGERGLLPPSGVPAGSPTKQDISDVVAEAPVPQAGFVAALIKAAPLPAASMSFTVSGTLSATLAAEGSPLALLYQVVVKGPRTSVTLGRSMGSTWGEVIDRAGKDIYRDIAAGAPGLYPRWSRWCSRAALDAFADGLLAESADEPRCAFAPEPDDVTLAAAHYRTAAERDPDNMLVRLRIANCLERKATSLAAGARCVCRLEALEEYVSIRVRQATIFSAGFRASVLLSQIADDDANWGMDPGLCRRLALVLDRLEHSRPAGDPPAAQPLSAALARAAILESRRARHQLWPWWTIIVERRFRHRFEPTGRDRRQLRKALRVSKLCIRVRKLSGLWVLGERALEGFVWLRFMVGRQDVAGWQAHYNVACFYALLPRAGDAIGGRRLRALALKHLRLAIEQTKGGELDCAYVRDEDADLATLRVHCRPELERVLLALCPDELVVHLDAAGDGWSLYASGAALYSAARADLPLASSNGDGRFRVRVFDENLPVHLVARNAGSGVERTWDITPNAVQLQISLDPLSAR